MNHVLRRVSRIAETSYRHPRLVFAGWAVLFVLAALGYLFGGGRVLSNAEGFVGESGRAEQLEASHDFVQSRTETVLVEASDSAAAQAAADDLVAELGGAEGVEKVDRVLAGSSGDSRVVQVLLHPGEGSVGERVVGMQAAMQEVSEARPGAQISATGPWSVRADVTATYAEKLSLLELLSLPITAILLFLVFAGAVATAVPLITGVSVVLVAMSGAGITSNLVPADSNQASLILLMGLALGVDYSLFFVRRAREEFRAHPGDSDRAVSTAVSRTVRSVVIAGLTVGVSVIPLFATGSSIFRSLALGLILVVLAAMLASATLLPALLRTGRNRIVNTLFGRHRTSPADGCGFWGRLVGAVVARPVAWTVLGVIALVALAAPVATMRLEVPGTDSMPRTFASLATLDKVSAEYPLYGISHTAVTPVDGDRQAAADRLQAIAERASQQPGFDPEVRQVQFSSDGELARVEIPVDTAETESAVATRTLTELREQIVPDLAAGADVPISGETAVSVDYSSDMIRDIAVVFPCVLLLCFLMLLAGFRSVKLAAVSVGLNLLSVLASYGVLVIVFQYGLGAPLFGAEYTRPIVTLLPIMLFVILFGLSMDYHVLILSRIAEARQSGLDSSAAIRSGIVKSAAPVTAAALVMVVIFALFAVLPTTEMKQLGVGLAVAVGLDATVVRGVLLPAVLAWMGDSAWPRRDARPEPGSTLVRQRVPAGCN